MHSLAPSSIPTFLKATSLSPTIISITWEHPLYTNQNGIITSYTLTYQGVERDSLLRTLTLPQSSQSLTCHNIDSLEEYTTYNVTLSASTSQGAGPVAYVTVRTDENGMSCLSIILYWIVFKFFTCRNSFNIKYSIIIYILYGFKRKFNSFFHSLYINFLL